MIVGTLGFLAGLALPVAIVVVLVRRCGGCRCWRERFYGCFEDQCPKHQTRIDRLINALMAHPLLALVMLFALILGPSFGMATLDCGWPHLDDNCYGGVPWP